MSDFVSQFGNIYDRTKKKIVKQPGLLEAAELFDNYSKQLPPEQKSLCHIGASQCYKSCGEEIEQVKQLVSAAVLLLKGEEGNREDNLSSGLSLLGRAIDICNRQNCAFLAFKLCLEASNACIRLDLCAKSIPWLKKATEIDTGSNFHKLTAVDLLLKSLIFEGDLHQALFVASEFLKDLQSDKKPSVEFLKQEVATLKVSTLLLYSILKPRTGYESVEVWSTEVKEFEETNLTEGIAFGLGNLFLALEEGDLDSVKEAQRILSPLLKDEQNILVQLLID